MNVTRTRDARRRRAPATTFGMLALVLTALGTAALYLWLGWNVYWLWLLALNVVTWVFYRLDKRRAQHEGAMRVPEIILLALTLLGGVIGAGIGMYMRPRHKTQKIKFKLSLWFAAASQVVLLYLLYYR